MEFLKPFWKQLERKETNRKTILIARSKPNSAEQIISKALTDINISHEEFTLAFNVAENYCRLKKQNKD